MIRKSHLSLFKNKNLQYRYYLIFFNLFFISLYCKAQITNNLATEYTFTTKATPNKNNSIQDINISWDFTQASNREQLILTIEIQPLNACWEKLNGTNRSALLSRNIEDFSKNYQGNLTLGLTELNSKCFKWRAKMTSNTGVNYTTWQFSSFL